MRCLFILRELPRPVVSVGNAIKGLEALSGTHASGLLVAEGLARNGHSVGMCILSGQELMDGTCRTFTSLKEASHWVGDGRVIWLSYGDESILGRLLSEGLKPAIWTQLPVTRTERAWLEDGTITGLITVSDTCRMPLIRSKLHASVGRIYNPLAPIFTETAQRPPDRYERHVVAYAGAAGPTKGLHRLLETWRHVRKRDPRAILRIAGTGRLYGSVRELGQFGIASPEFESQYVAPIAEEFGSLSAAGIETVGLLSPMQLRDLYASASLGVVNMNWSEFTETFCCAATEMLATGLPVFSVARGALPETIGRSGGAFLTKQFMAQDAAEELASLLSNATHLSTLGQLGRQYVCREYGWDRIVREWSNLLRHDSNVEELSGPWRGPRSLRYFVESTVGRLGMPWVIDAPARVFRKFKARRAVRHATAS